MRNIIESKNLNNNDNNNNPIIGSFLLILSSLIYIYFYFIMSDFGGLIGAIGVLTFTGILGVFLCFKSKYDVMLRRFIKRYKIPFLIFLSLFLWGIQFWWGTTELLAFWLALGISLPVLIILIVIQKIINIYLTKFNLFRR